MINQDLKNYCENNKNIFFTIDSTLNLKEQFYLLKNNGNYGDETPQVEIFCELLKKINSKIPSIIEIGSGGVHASFYSILFEKWFEKQCKIINIEPRKNLIDCVKIFWKNKHLDNTILYHGYCGNPAFFQSSIEFYELETPKINIIDVMKENNISKLDILHMDIQGSEFSVCEELEKNYIFDKIKYFFISTHKNQFGYSTHNECKMILSKNLNCFFHYDDPHSGGCGDGLLVVENLNF